MIYLYLKIVSYYYFRIVTRYYTHSFTKRKHIIHILRMYCYFMTPDIQETSRYAYAHAQVDENVQPAECYIGFITFNCCYIIFGVGI